MRLSIQGKDGHVVNDSDISVRPLAEGASR